jgi:hypothetical protein
VGDDGSVTTPHRARRWTSFVADSPAAAGTPVRGLHEQANPRHRLRAEHDDSTLLIHLSDEDGDGWTTIAVDRATRRWAVAQAPRQSDTARSAYESLYRPDPD